MGSSRDDDAQKKGGGYTKIVEPKPASPGYGSVHSGNVPEGTKPPEVSKNVIEVGEQEAAALNVNTLSAEDVQSSAPKGNIIGKFKRRPAVVAQTSNAASASETPTPKAASGQYTRVPAESNPTTPSYSRIPPAQAPSQPTPPSATTSSRGPMKQTPKPSSQAPGSSGYEAIPQHPLKGAKSLSELEPSSSTQKHAEATSKGGMFGGSKPSDTPAANKSHITKSKK